MVILGQLHCYCVPPRGIMFSNKAVFAETGNADNIFAGSVRSMGVESGDH